MSHGDNLVTACMGFAYMDCSQKKNLKSLRIERNTGSVLKPDGLEMKETLYLDLLL